MSETAAEHSALAAQAGIPVTEDLTVRMGGQVIGGWETIEVVRSVERCPSIATISMTERFPGTADVLRLPPGQPCEVWLGADKVITGYVDRYEPSVSPQGHEVTAFIRSKCEDLVDCSAFLPDMTVTAASLLQLATSLCAPFKITVSEPQGEGTPATGALGQIPQFNISLGQTPFELIELVARWLRMLVHDDVDGNLVLDKVGTTKAGSGFSLPGNVQRARVSFGMDQRFSVYLPAAFSTQVAFNGLVEDPAGANRFPPVYDKGVQAMGRYRPRFVVSEQQIENYSLAEDRAQWECTRRYGRSQSVTLVCDSWRDAAGKLWTPNTLAPLNLPSMKVVGLTWLISEVAYLRGKEGTQTRVVLMPKEAFAPEPDWIGPYDPLFAVKTAPDVGNSSNNPNFNPRFGETFGGT